MHMYSQHKRIHLCLFSVIVAVAVSVSVAVAVVAAVALVITVAFAVAAAHLSNTRSLYSAYLCYACILYEEFARLARD